MVDGLWWSHHHRFLWWKYSPLWLVWWPDSVIQQKYGYHPKCDYDTWWKPGSYRFHVVNPWWKLATERENQRISIIIEVPPVIHCHNRMCTPDWCIPLQKCPSRENRREGLVDCTFTITYLLVVFHVGKPLPIHCWLHIPILSQSIDLSLVILKK